VRLWQRTFNRAGIQIAYSSGFTPHPRISLAAPLPIGVTSESELMDVVCIRGVAPHFFVNAVNRQLPEGINTDKVYPIGLELPSLQSQLIKAEYKVRVNTETGLEDISKSIDNLLALEHLEWQHLRDTGPKKYDLRALIDDIKVLDWDSPIGTLWMRLSCGAKGSGRPEQVTAALGCIQRPESIHRTQLILQTRSS